MPISKELIQQLREMDKRAYPLNEPQQKTLEKMLKFLHGCSRADLIIRINGRNEVLEADFFQYHMPLYVSLRNNIIPLLDEIERLQGENERLKKEIDFAYKPL